MIENDSSPRTNAMLMFLGYHVVRMHDVIDKMATNTLYSLRINHPVIDGVGVLIDRNG